MTRIYRLNTIDVGDIDSTYLAVLEDDAGVQTSKTSLSQLVNYLFNLASTADESSPFSGLSLVIGDNSTGTGDSAVSLGKNNVASGDSSTCVGYANVASTYGSLSCGYGNSVATQISAAAGYGNSISSYSGEYSYSGYNNQIFGTNNNIQGGYCTIVGAENVVVGINLSEMLDNENYMGRNSVLGLSNTCIGTHCLALGSGNQVATEGPMFASTAVGFSNSVNGFYGCTGIGMMNNSSAPATTTCGYKNVSNEQNSSSFGSKNTSSGQNATTCGYGNTSSNIYSSCFGVNNVSLAPGSTCCGYACYSGGISASAFGFQAIARSDNTVNIGGGIVIRGDNGESSDSVFNNFSGVQNVIMSKDCDLTTTFDIEIDIPFNCIFYVDEVGIILDNVVEGVTVQPTVRFGWADNLDQFLSATQTTNLIQLNSREIYSELLTYDGQQTLTAGVTVGATATYLHGRFYFVGVLLEMTPVTS